MQAHRARLVVVFSCALLATASPAFAGGSSEPPPVVKGRIYHRGTPRSSGVVVHGLVSRRPATLPLTGGDVTLATLAGLGLVGAGAAVVRGTRARRD